MALPTTPAMKDLAVKLFVQHMKDQEQTLRDLLSLWVSELEPVVMYHTRNYMQIMGLGIKDDPTGLIVIANPKFRLDPEWNWFSDAL